jgi:CHAD domain-containing protein
VRWEVARHLSQSVAERSRTLLEADPWTADGGHEAETVRQMRVASRRLRTFVELFEPRLPPKLARRLRRTLRSVTRALGPLRDWDVYFDALQARLMGADGGQAAAIEHVLVDIARQRDEARRAARAALEDVDRARLHGDLDRAVGTVIGPYVQMSVEAKTDAWSLLRPRVEALVGRVAEVGDLCDRQKVHGVRIAAKRLRYAYELLGPAFDDPRRAREPLKRVQRVIGDARDRQLLVDFLECHRSALHGQGRPHLASGLMPLLATLATEALEADARIPEAMTHLDRRLPARTRAALGALPVALVGEEQAS